MYSRKKMKSALESMMFVWGEPLSAKDAAAVLEADRKEILELFEELKKEYEQEGRGIRLREVNEAFQFVTYADNEMFIEKLCRPVKVKRLSQAALEVLAIIAYKQPVTRAEIDAIRGIKSERVIDGLINRNFVAVCGKSDGIGRPNLYGTTDEFLKAFGFETLKDLPDIGEFREADDSEEILHGQLAMKFDSDDMPDVSPDNCSGMQDDIQDGNPEDISDANPENPSRAIPEE
jgi:segregation and condensation protein B